MAKPKFYAFKGEENKIFSSWEECSEYMSGKKGYTYKSFSSLAEAEAYLSGEDFYANAVENDLKSGYAVAYTDGSYEESINGYSYGVIAIGENGKEERYSGFGTQEDFLPSRNVAGEAIGAITAIKWAYFNGFEKLKIYHDYEGLAFWAEKKWSAKSPISLWYVSELKRYIKAVKTEFVKVKGHSNDKYNEEADKLAKNAILYGEYLPLKISNGFQFDGELYNAFLENFNREAGKTEISYRRGGVSFTRGEERLNAYLLGGYAVVSGNYGFLYSLAASVVCKAYRENPRKIGIILSNAFDCDIYFAGEYSGVSAAEGIARAITAENYAPLSIFALHGAELKLKDLLGLDKGDKLSERFDYNGKDFKLKVNCPDTEKAEKLYSFFYKYRTSYYGLYMDKDRFDEFVSALDAMGD